MNARLSFLIVKVALYGFLLAAAGHRLAATTLYWDPNLTNTSGGGSGTWTTTASTKNWFPGSGTDTNWTAGYDAVFAGTAGTVGIAASGIAPNSITINTGGYTLQNNAAGTILITLGDFTVNTSDHAAVTIGNASNVLTLNMGATTRTYSVATGDSVTFLNQIRGSAGLNKTGGGTMIISQSASNGTASTSNFYGTTTVSAGTLQLGVAGAFNSSGSLAVAGGTFNLSSFAQTIASVQLTSGGSITGTSTGVLTSASVFDLQSGSVSAVLAGSGGLTKTTAGTVTLSGANTYTGTTALNGGILNVNTDAGLGATSTNITMDGGTLQFGAAFNITNTRTFTLGSGGGTIDTNGYTISTGISNAISGSGGLTKAGGGTLTLGASKTYMGGTTVTGGTLQFSVSNVLPSTGDLTVNGGTVDVRTAAQTTSGNLVVISGSVNASGGTSGAIKANGFDLRAGTVNARLQDNASGATLTKTTAGTATLSGVASNGYTGKTSVSAGTLLLSTSGNSISSTGASATGGSAAAQAASSDVQITGGSVALGAANQIVDTAKIGLSGGKLDTQGFSEGARTAAGIGALTLSANSIIDFGGTNNTFVHFAASNGQLWSGTLNIYNWSGSMSGNGVDQLLFGADSTALTSAQLAEIQFFSDAGMTPLGTGTFGSIGEVVPTPVPEPATVIGGGLLACLATWNLRRRRGGSCHLTAL